MLLTHRNEFSVVHEKGSVISSAGGHRMGARLHHDTLKHCLSAHLIEAGAGNFFRAHIEIFLSKIAVHSNTIIF
jgi:mannitol-1-phosphate/altronate dehydrogenase